MNITSKHIFARWQAILSNFDFQIEYIKGENNSIPDFLTCEFLQDSQDHNPQKKEKQPLKLIKKSPDSKKSHSTLSEKFMSHYYEHFEVAGSCNFSKNPISSKSPKHSTFPIRDKIASLNYLPSAKDSFPTIPLSNDTNPLSGYLKSLCDL